MAPDPVTAPSHYLDGRSIEPIAVIEDWKLDYHLGNALKYIARAGRKDDFKQDIAKAIWYLQRRIRGNNEQTTQLHQSKSMSRQTSAVSVLCWTSTEPDYSCLTQLRVWI